MALEREVWVRNLPTGWAWESAYIQELSPAHRPMGTQKPRILPWLISQLNQGQLEGVAWLDEGHTRFRIPWKHGLRQDAQQEDFGIFQVRARRARRTPRGRGRGMGSARPRGPRLFWQVGVDGVRTGRGEVSTTRRWASDSREDWSRQVPGIEPGK